MIRRWEIWVTPFLYLLTVILLVAINVYNEREISPIFHHELYDIQKIIRPCEINLAISTVMFVDLILDFLCHWHPFNGDHFHRLFFVVILTTPSALSIAFKNNLKQTAVIYVCSRALQLSGSIVATISMVILSNISDTHRYFLFMAQILVLSGCIAFSMGLWGFRQAHVVGSLALVVGVLVHIFLFFCQFVHTKMLFRSWASLSNFQMSTILYNLSLFATCAVIFISAAVRHVPIGVSPLDITDLLVFEYSFVCFNVFVTCISGRVARHQSEEHSRKYSHSSMQLSSLCLEIRSPIHSVNTRLDFLGFEMKKLLDRFSHKTLRDITQVQVCCSAAINVVDELIQSGAVDMSCIEPERRYENIMFLSHISHQYRKAVKRAGVNFTFINQFSRVEQKSTVVLVDKRLIQQALSDLLLAWVKATPAEGSVTMTIRKGSLTMPSFKSNRSNESALIQRGCACCRRTSAEHTRPQHNRVAPDSASSEVAPGGLIIEIADGNFGTPYESRNKALDRFAVFNDFLVDGTGAEPPGCYKEWPQGGREDTSNRNFSSAKIHSLNNFASSRDNSGHGSINSDVSYVTSFRIAHEIVTRNGGTIAYRAPVNGTGAQLSLVFPRYVLSDQMSLRGSRESSKSVSSNSFSFTLENIMRELGHTAQFDPRDCKIGSLSIELNPGGERYDDMVLTQGEESRIAAVSELCMAGGDDEALYASIASVAADRRDSAILASTIAKVTKGSGKTGRIVKVTANGVTHSGRLKFDSRHLEALEVRVLIVDDSPVVRNLIVQYFTILSRNDGALCNNRIVKVRIDDVEDGSIAVALLKNYKYKNRSMRSNHRISSRDKGETSLSLKSNSQSGHSKPRSSSDQGSGDEEATSSFAIANNILLTPRLASQSEENDTDYGEVEVRPVVISAHSGQGFSAHSGLGPSSHSGLGPSGHSGLGPSGHSVGGAWSRLASQPEEDRMQKSPSGSHEQVTSFDDILPKAEAPLPSSAHAAAAAAATTTTTPVTGSESATATVALIGSAAAAATLAGSSMQECGDASTGGADIFASTNITTANADITTASTDITTANADADTAAAAAAVLTAAYFTPSEHNLSRLVFDSSAHSSGIHVAQSTAHTPSPDHPEAESGDKDATAKRRRDLIGYLRSSYGPNADPLGSSELSIGVNLHSSLTVAGQASNGSIETPREAYDVIFIDSVMKEVHGPDATKRIRALGFKGLIVAMCGSDNFSEAFAEAGADHMLNKRLDLASLRDIMRAVVFTLQQREALQAEPREAP